jgi:hypothetical protein
LATGRGWRNFAIFFLVGEFSSTEERAERDFVDGVLRANDGTVTKQIDRAMNTFL